MCIVENSKNVSAHFGMTAPLSGMTNLAVRYIPCTIFKSDSC